jgi:hypothetical protein
MLTTANFVLPVLDVNGEDTGNSAELRLAMLDTGIRITLDPSNNGPMIVLEVADDGLRAIFHPDDGDASLIVDLSESRTLVRPDPSFLSDGTLTIEDGRT